MTKTMTAMIAVLALAAGLSAQHGKMEAPTFTGTWNMGLQGDHVIPVALVLTQDGNAVTGTIAMPTNRSGDRVDVPLKGGIANGALTLSGTVEGAKTPTTIAITGTLNEDGAIEGTFAMQGHDMPFTAERLKERK